MKNIKLFENGIITGTYASLIATARIEKFPLHGFYISSFPNFPDPLAAARAINDIINPLFNLELSAKELIEKGNEIQLQFHNLASQTRQMQTRQRSDAMYL